MNRQRDDFAIQGRFINRPLSYASMSLADIGALPVRSITDPTGSRLFLWTTNAFLPHAFGVLTSWGFTYKQTLVWHKTDPVPLPIQVAPSSAEFLLVATIGKPERTGIMPSSVLTHGALKEHSRKPDLFVDYIEHVSPGPYVELFARRHRLGWDVWGHESANTAELAV